MPDSKETFYPTFSEVADDLSLLPYDPEHPDDEGRVLIGNVESADRSVMSWTIVPLNDGWGLELAVVAEGLDDDGNYIAPSEGEPKAYFLPIREPAAGLPIGDARLEGLAENTPGCFHSVQDAFDAFLDVVYTTERTEEYEEIAEEARRIVGGYFDAECADFAAFKEAFANVTKWDGHAHTWHTTKLGNAMLCLRYPFLVPWPFRKDQRVWEERALFDHTHFDSLPEGWKRRFGLELFEDIRNQNYAEDPRAWRYRNCHSTIHQIKEKFGGLRVYMDCYGNGQSLICAYECVSQATCIDCGRADKTRITHGYILPLCWDEVITESRRRKAIEDAGEERFLSDEKRDALQDQFDWDKRWAARKFALLETVLGQTSASYTSEELRGLTENWRWRSTSEGEVNKAAGLLDGTPAPNGQPVWAREVILAAADEVAALERRCAEGCPVDDEALAKFVSESGTPLPDWFRANGAET